MYEAETRGAVVVNRGLRRKVAIKKVTPRISAALYALPMYGILYIDMNR